MRQQKAILRYLAASIGLALAMPLCASAAAATNGKAGASYAALADIAASATLIDAWRDYAFASLRPDFSWASDADETIRAPSIFERGRARLLPPSSHWWLPIERLRARRNSSVRTDTPLYARPAEKTR
jgi:hypothetical protein